MDPKFAETALKNKEQGIANIIVAGESYGQGSSREHAALCPMFLGVRAVVAKSFERIHNANLVNFGILPLIFVNPEDYDKISKDDKLLIENIEKIKTSKEIELNVPAKNLKIALTHNLSDRQVDLILDGGLLNKAKKSV